MRVSSFDDVKVTITFEHALQSSNYFQVPLDLMTSARPTMSSMEVRRSRVRGFGK